MSVSGCLTIMIKQELLVGSFTISEELSFVFIKDWIWVKRHCRIEVWLDHLVRTPIGDVVISIPKLETSEATYDILVELPFNAFAVPILEGIPSPYLKEFPPLRDVLILSGVVTLAIGNGNCSPITSGRS